MTITVIGKVKPQIYEINCTDENCRNIIQFDQDDVRWVSNSVAGRTTATTKGITCPDCNQILAMSDATKIE